MENLSVKNQENGFSLLKNSISLSKFIELVLTTEEVVSLHHLLSKLNRKSAIQKTDGYIHLVNLIDNVDKVLKKTKPDHSTINTPKTEVLRANVYNS